MLLAPLAMAQNVSFRLPSREAWVGTPLQMMVEVNNAADDAVPTVADSQDFEARVQPVPQRMEMQQNINGRVTRRSTLTWTVEFTPLREGTFTLPTVQVKSDTRTWTSPPETVTVASSAASELLRVEVVASPASPWVGQGVELTLRMLVRPYINARFNVQLDEAQMWQLLDAEASSWGVFLPRLRELAQTNRRPQGDEERIDGQTWIAYELTQTVTPGKSGPVDTGDVRIVWKYPTGVTAERGFFGGRELSLTGVRPVSAAPQVSSVQVRALPAEGRPANFRGAVGNFVVHAQAKPSQVAVGDPITLTVTVVDLSQGGTDLQTLQPPVIDQASLGGEFRVPSDPLAGTVDGNAKTFTQTIRPLSATLTQVPPIEFSYFDPELARYVTVKTQPIPISVSPSERIGAERFTMASQPSKAAETLTEVEGGVLANAMPDAAMLRDDRLRLGAGTAVVFAAPPLLALVALLVRRRLDRLGGDAGLARSRRAFKSAQQALIAAADAAAIAAALCNYVADRTRHAAGTVTRSQALQLARQAGATETTLATLDDLIGQGERVAFAPVRTALDEGARTRALELIRSLDALRWTRRQMDVLEEVNA
jgi:hypothetical protein